MATKQSGAKKKTAPKKSTAKPKTTSTNKRGSAAAASAAAKQQAVKAEHQRRQIGAVLLFAIALLLLAIVLIAGQNIWNGLHNFFLGLFGVGAYILPFLLGFIAIRISATPELSMRTRLLHGMILLALLCGSIQTVFVGNFDGTSFGNVLGNLYEKGIQVRGGGIYSALVGWPLTAAFGRTGAIIFLVIFLFAFILLVSGKNLLDFFNAVKKPVQQLEQNYVQKREEIEQRRLNSFNVDVDLGGEAPMPSHPVSSPRKSAAPAFIEPPRAAVKPDEGSSVLDQFFADNTMKNKGNAKQPRDNFFEAVSRGKEESLKNREELKQEKAEQLDALVFRATGKQAEPKRVEAGPLEVQESAPLPDMPPEVIPEEPKLSKAQERAIVSEQTAEVTKEIQATEAPKQVELYKYPPVTLLKAPKRGPNNDLSEELRQNAELLVNTLKSFGVQTRVIDISRGPTVTRYELQPSAGVKISKITGLADDIALNLAAAGVRIEAPIPNKAAVGIEVPNKNTDIVTIREIIDSDKFRDAKSKLSVALGRDISGQEVVFDIGKMPHMLIAGATGSGKSVCINALIMSILYKATPDEVRLLMIDPKVVELGVYNGIPHLLVPVVTDPRKAAGALGWAVTEMLNRYKLFAEHQVRDLNGYNALAAQDENMNPMPQIVIIIDELADLMMAAPNEVEDAICRLAQMARAAGMHLVIATQRPSVDVITGVIKANIPSRIAFSVSSQVDSRTIIDSGGAEKLLGRGDMLFYPVGLPKPVRLQCCFVSDKEVESAVEFVKNASNPDYDDKIMDEIERQAVQEKGAKSNDDGGGFDDEDELLPQAIEVVIEAGQASTSYLQRKLKVGYARAARLMDDMEMKNIIGPSEGSKPRQVLMNRQQWIEMRMLQTEDANAPVPEEI